MSYDPSHRKPPRQERWPNATPPEGWPAYRQGEADQAWRPVGALAGGSSNGYADARDGQGGAWDGQGGTWDPDGQGGAWDGSAWGGEAGSGYRTAGNGYGRPATAYPAAGDRFSDGFDGGVVGYGAVGGYEAASGYGAATDYDTSTDYNATADYEAGNSYGGRDGYREWDGYGGRDGYRERDGYGGRDGYRERDGFGGREGYGRPGQEFTGSAGYLEQNEHPGVGSGASSVLVAPDLRGEWWQQPDEGDGAARAAGHDQVIIAAVTGFLSAAVAIGVATLAAGFVRPQASPASLIGGVLLDRLPAGLKSMVTAHLGAHGGTVLLLGVTGVIAVVLGCAARRNASLGVAGLAAAGLLGAFVAITRPESRAIDILPPAIGVAAGIVALLWLARMSVPLRSAPLRSVPLRSAPLVSAPRMSSRPAEESRRRTR